MDHVVRLETSIREANIKKQHLVAVFFDLEKAYETTWRYGIMKDLHNMGLRGRLPNFIKVFLTDRKFRVRIGRTLSDIQNQEEGVPQGSILSVTLFNIKINSITNCLNPGVDSYLYVDDFCITYKSKYIRTAERQLQQNINKIKKWATTNGFKISKTKTQCVHFCQIRKMHNDPKLKLDDSEIPVVNQYKFLGIIFDQKLSFNPHIQYLKDKCSRTLKLLRIIAHKNWGADFQTLLKLYRTLIRSKIDYGCYIYGAARKSYLKQLNTVHHEGLRLILGAFKTSPVDSLYSEAYEPPLKIRFTKLGLQYYTKIKSIPTNPAYDCIFNPKNQTLFNQKEKAIKTFGLRMKPILEEANIPIGNIHDSLQLSSPPWLLKQSKVILDLNKLSKKKTHPLTYQEKLYNIHKNYPNYLHIYTDGSKDNQGTGCGAVLNNKTMKQSLPKEASIFSAEICAIYLALKIISANKSKKFIIHSDSISVLHSIKNKKLDNPLIVKLLNKLHYIRNSKNVIFCWIPGHMGIQGNDKADLLAKTALNIPPDKTSKLPYTDLKYRIKQIITKKWQQLWDDNSQNKLYQIEPLLKERKLDASNSRREETTLSRLRIGHTRLTHSFILKEEPPPKCPCGNQYTIRHILIECTSLYHIRKKYYNVNNMKELFERIDSKNIINFLKRIGLLSRL